MQWCPKDVLSVLEDMTWLGLKLVPETKLSFQHSHVPMSTCPSLRPLINLGGRRFLVTVRNGYL